MEKKKLKLSISGSSKKTFNSIEQAKSQSRNTVLIEKKVTRFGNKPNYPRPNQNESINAKPGFFPKNSLKLLFQKYQALLKGYARLSPDFSMDFVRLIYFVVFLMLNKMQKKIFGKSTFLTCVETIFRSTTGKTQN